jgi:hypothetical protein
LIGAAFVAGVLIMASGGEARADEPRRLHAQAAVSPGDAQSHCLPALVKADETCEVGKLGPVGAVETHNFSYAQYDLAPGPSSPLYRLHYPRIVIFERLPAGTLRPILISGDDAAFIYSKPVILRAGGRIVLHIPAYESGTGNFNREILYVWAKDRWHDVDATGWLVELAHKLPKGLSVRQGVYPDYATMAAETPLSHEEDPMHCPEGGRAHMGLQWRGDRISVGTVRIGKAGECGEPLPPSAPTKPR